MRGISRQYATVARSSKLGQSTRKVEVDHSKIPEKKYPHDFGILPGTFVMPTGTGLPPWSKPLARLRLYQNQAVLRAKGVLGLLFYKYNCGVKPRPLISGRRAKAAALALHQRLYTALAANDKATLKEICCEGLYSRLCQSLGQRSAGERAEWRLHRYRGLQRLVSDSALTLPVDNSALRQTVVRIRSRQSLVHYRDGQPKGPEQPKDLVEQLVLQRRIFRGREGPWRIWGTGG